MEYWNGRIMKFWTNKARPFDKTIVPFFQYSILPSYFSVSSPPNLR